MTQASWHRLWFWLPAFIALAAVLAWLFRPQPVAVDLATVARGPLQVSVSDDGETRVRDMFVVSAPVAGHMRRIELEAGDRVVAGETIVARIEPSDPSFLDRRSERKCAPASVPVKPRARMRQPNCVVPGRTRFRGHRAEPLRGPGHQPHDLAERPRIGPPPRTHGRGRGRRGGGGTARA